MTSTTLGHKKCLDKWGAVQPLLDDLNIEGSVVTGDALLTQKEIAAYIVEEKKADYLFTVKGNQKTLLSDQDDR